MIVLRRRGGLPAELVGQLGPDERVLAGTRTLSGGLLAATRFGLWIDIGAGPRRTGWELISRAVLRERTLTVTTATVVRTWPGDIAVLADQPSWEIELPGPTKVTDVVHARVRASVAVSEHIPAGGWLVLRRVPGRDGLAAQFRLDPLTDPDLPDLVETVTGRLTALRSVRNVDG